jgi:uncharacterized HAD superfamily protein
MKCFLIDIDGTIADGGHRLHYISKEPKQWDAYFMACGGDAPIQHMHKVVESLSLKARIVYVSGRSDLVRKQTLQWLVDHDFPMDALYMRKQGDHKNDHDLKIELLAQLREDGYEPIMAFDDRDRVVKAWRAAGIPCAQVAEGDF